MPLNFHQLHIFHTVADRGSFSAAAQALYMTQPAVTMQVQSLEEYFGTKLFMRSTKKIELTEAGKVLLPYAKRSIDLIRDTDQAMTSFTQQQKGRLLLGASLTIGESILPRWLGPFGKEYPNIGISMKVMNTTHLIEEIETHQLNFAIIEAPIQHHDMHIEAVMEDELVLVVPADHPLTKLGTPLSLENVLKYPFILREQGSGTRQVMEDKLIENGYDPQQLQIVMELGSTGAIKSAVEAGLGISFLSVSSVKHEAALGLISVLSIDNVTFKRKFYAVYLKSALLPMSAVTFMNFLRERDLRQWL
ncbi:selenium metabolism-associated LysR family transcriptional regulator [Paenibacillus septentrionalis]|uniref:Selenium metabolism-associated LysR family transcriptional regulator n=1 Tax=Paenibacillus septentrionalis TaxID=429342 RepID=A0ABW1UXU7_9BACL